MSDAVQRQLNDLRARIDRIERSVGLKRPRARLGHPPANSDWIGCRNAGCQRSSYKQAPACLECAGYDPRDPQWDGVKPLPRNTPETTQTGVNKSGQSG